MTVNQVLNKTGSFSVKLKAATPPHIRLLPNAGGYAFNHIVITKAPIPDTGLSRSNLLSQSIFTGRLDYIHNRLEFVGTSLLGWLGDGDSPPKGPSPVVAGPGTFTHFITGALPQNGISAGSAFGVSATVINDDINFVSTSAPESLRSALDRFSSITGDEYRVNNDTTCDYGQPGSLYKSAGNIDLILMRDADGIDPGGLNGMNAVSFDVVEDWTDYANNFRVTYPGGVVTTGFPIWAPDGTTATSYAESSDSDTTGANAGDKAAELAAKYVERRTVTVEVDTFRASRFFTRSSPGDFVYIFDPETGLVDPSQAAIAYQGQWVNPINTRITEVDWPIKKGMGVYYWATNDADASVPTAASGTITDLTEFVDWDSGTTKIICAPQQGPTLTRAILGSHL